MVGGRERVRLSGRSRVVVRICNVRCKETVDSTISCDLMSLIEGFAGASHFDSWFVLHLRAESSFESLYPEPAPKTCSGGGAKC